MNMDNINEQYFDYLEGGVARHPYIWRNFKIVEKRQWLYKDYPTIDDVNKIYFSSDHHFGHNNIIRYSDRPFPDTNLMRDCMIGNHNKVISNEDTWICVGDFAFLHDDVANEILNQLNGFKILIIGNHDIYRRKVKNLNFDAIYPCLDMTIWDIPMFISHYPFHNIPTGWLNIHGHEHITHREATGNQFYNVNVELHNYKPVSIQKIIEHARKTLIAQ